MPGAMIFEKGYLSPSWTITTTNYGSAPTLPAVTGVVGTGPNTALAAPSGGLAAGQLISSPIFCPRRVGALGLVNFGLSMKIINTTNATALGTTSNTTMSFRVFGRLRSDMLWFPHSATTAGVAISACAQSTIGGQRVVQAFANVSSALYPEMYLQLETWGTWTNASGSWNTFGGTIQIDLFE